MDFFLVIITFISNMIVTIKITTLHIIMRFTSLFTQEEIPSRVKWKENIQDIYYTYSKEEYDRKPFIPYLFQRNFFK